MKKTLALTFAAALLAVAPGFAQDKMDKMDKDKMSDSGSGKMSKTKKHKKMKKSDNTFLNTLLLTIIMLICTSTLGQ